MAVFKMSEKVDSTFTYQSTDKFITWKEKSPYSIQNYLEKAIGCSWKESGRRVNIRLQKHW